MIICKTNGVVRLSFIVSVANHPSTELYYYHAIWPTHEEQQQNPQRRRHIFMLSRASCLLLFLPRRRQGQLFIHTVRILSSCVGGDDDVVS